MGSRPDHGTRSRVNVSYRSPELARNTARDRTVNDGLSTEGWLVLKIWETTPAPEASDRVAPPLRRWSRS